MATALMDPIEGCIPFQGGQPADAVLAEAGAAAVTTPGDARASAATPNMAAPRM
jgi:hypothetical protein